MDYRHCPVCLDQHLTVFLRRDQVPVHQNLVVQDPDAARSIVRGELEMAVCEKCGFVFNRAFDLSRLSYGEHYDNSQSYSGYFDSYLDELVNTLINVESVRDSVIVEVGCGKGQFLRKLVTFPGANNRGIGFDPSYTGPESDLDGRLSFQRCYYDDSCTDVAADVVVCRHVIEHVPEPMVLLKSVRAALKHSPNAKVFFETPCVEWILRNQVVWDFFYEHCSLFSPESLRRAFQLAGFSVDRVKHIFGGQYLWIEARPAKESPTIPFEPQNTAALAMQYARDEQALRRKWRTELEALKQHGKVGLWGAGAKGATFANLADPDRTLIECVVDVNPNKQGSYIPGTGHPIIAPHDLPGKGVRKVVLMNPNYRAENQRLLEAAGIEIDLIDWSE